MTLLRPIILKHPMRNLRRTLNQLESLWSIMVRKDGIPIGIQSRKIPLTLWWKISKTTY